LSVVSVVSACYRMQPLQCSPVVDTSEEKERESVESSSTLSEATAEAASVTDCSSVCVSLLLESHAVPSSRLLRHLEVVEV
jgi:hypothetical protein